MRLAGGGHLDGEVEGLGVYSADDRSVQVTWRGVGAGGLTIGAGDVAVDLEAPPPAALTLRGRRPRRLGRLAGGPGAAVLDGLEPDTAYPLWLRTEGGARRVVGKVRTLPRPAGRELYQLATVNDIHIGEARFGPLGIIEDHHPLPDAVEPYPLRCARAAITEAAGWGARHLVVKGDLTRSSEPGEFRAVGRLLAGSGLETDVVLGNHDNRHGVDAAAVLSPFGIDARPVARHRDLPGLRIILAHTPGPGDKWGSVGPEQADRVARLAASAPGASMLVVHHPPSTSPVLTHYPPGIRRADTLDLLRRVATANPATVVVAGHTHRNRVRFSHGLPVVETTSTKDHPGGWTGYRVFEGGLVQTARRVSAHPAMAWTEASRRALGGQWGRWAPGTLADRCWSLTWPAR